MCGDSGCNEVLPSKPASARRGRTDALQSRVDKCESPIARCKTCDYINVRIRKECAVVRLGGLAPARPIIDMHLCECNLLLLIGKMLHT